jgi:hypothetical protein
VENPLGFWRLNVQFRGAEGSEKISFRLEYIWNALVSLFSLLYNRLLSTAAVPNTVHIKHCDAEDTSREFNVHGSVHRKNILICIQ